MEIRQNKDVRISVRVAPEDRGKLAMVSLRTGKSKSEVIREALELYCKAKMPISNDRFDY